MNIFKEESYTCRLNFDRYVLGISEKGSRELFMFVGNTSKLYDIMKDTKEYNIHQHILRFRDNKNEPYDFMWFCLLDREKIFDMYDTITILVEEREIGGCMDKIPNRTMRLTEIEDRIIEDDVYLYDCHSHIAYLMKEFKMSQRMAIQTFKCMCDYSTPSFNTIIEWQEVEEVKEKSLIQKVIDKIKGGR